MTAKPSDEPSISAAEWMLRELGCPAVRRCQGNPRMERRIQSTVFRRTPDLVAGPTIGNGSPQDFLIDVKEISGEIIFNPKAKGGTAPPPMLVDPVKHKGKFNLSSYDHHVAYSSTIDDKLAKYSEERAGSPMVGLCIHIDTSYMRSNATIPKNGIQKFLHAIDYLRFLGEYFQWGDQVASKMAGKVLDDSELGCKNVLFLPFGKRTFAFLCYTILKHGRDLRGILLVNERLVLEKGPYHDHPVLDWLRQLHRKSEKWD